MAAGDGNPEIVVPRIRQVGIFVAQIGLQVGIDVHTFEAVGRKFAHIDASLSLDDEFGQQESGHSVVAEAARIEVAAEEKSGERRDGSDIGQSIGSHADEPDAVVGKFHSFHQRQPCADGLLYKRRGCGVQLQLAIVEIETGASDPLAFMGIAAEEQAPSPDGGETGYPKQLDLSKSVYSVQLLRVSSGFV